VKVSRVTDGKCQKIGGLLNDLAPRTRRLHVPKRKACLSPHAKVNRDDRVLAPPPNRLADAYFYVSHAVKAARNRPKSRKVRSSETGLRPDVPEFERKKHVPELVQQVHKL
jgi:hypothetical protein